MTHDKDSFEDAAFDAFLQGKGELAERLRELPQAEPSAELDAAILRRVEAEIAHIGPAAVNDAVGPGWFARWRLPIAAAASFLFALAIVMHQTDQHPSVDTSERVALASGEPSVSAVQPPERARLRREVEAGGSESGALAKSNADPSVHFSQSMLDQDRIQQPSAARNAGPAHSEEISAAKSPREGSAEPPVDGQGVDAQAREEAASVPDLASARQPSSAPAVAPESSGELVPERPQDRPPPSAAAPVEVRVMSSFAAASPAAQIEDPKAWLDRIQVLLKGDSANQAGSEWEKFRKAYPGYKVDEKLEAQLNALKK
jgi:hypothetical protein